MLEHSEISSPLRLGSSIEAMMLRGRYSRSRSCNLRLLMNTGAVGRSRDSGLVNI